jgi:hypothetical protein
MSKTSRMHRTNKKLNGKIEKTKTHHGDETLATKAL